jgi:glutamine amidotransferase
VSTVSSKRPQTKRRRGITVAVLDYGIGNLRSAQKALEHVGARAKLTSNLADINAADAVVLPGVGAFGACMDALEASGLDTAAVDAIDSLRPFLGICVGMQLLYAGSDETPGRAGLGIFKSQIRLLEDSVKRPQMQWNRLKLNQGPHPMFDGIDDPWMYFVHSFAAEGGPEVIATCDYGGEVTAAVCQDNVWATQFHPEKSAADGLAVLRNFCAWAESGMESGLSS